MEVKWFNDLMKVTRYYLEALKASKASSLGWAVNILKGRTHAFVDMALLTNSELLMTDYDGEVSLQPPTRLPEVEITVTEEAEKEADIDPDREHAFARLRELAQKHALNPFDREFLYGYPFVVGTVNDKPICAPPFTVPCLVEYDLNKRTLTIRRLTDEMEFNMRLWSHVLSESKQQILRQVLQDGIPELPLDNGQLLAFLRRLSNALDLQVPLEHRNFQLQRLPNPRELPNRLHVVSCAAVIWTVRMQHYLRADLEALASGTLGDVSQSVLRTFFKTPSLSAPELKDEEPPSEEPPSLEGLVFPFESNLDQRQITHALEKHDLIVVQGPPGTGKSQTISNLICHLVSQGKTVLVSSQKNKALEVVAERLEKLGVKYLAMTLLKGDKESRQRLASELEALDGHLQQLRYTAMTQRLQQLQTELEDEKGKTAQLRQAFETQRERERQMLETYRQFRETRSDDLFPPDSILPDGNDKQIADTLIHYAELYKACLPIWKELNEWMKTAGVHLSLSVADKLVGDWAKWKKIIEQIAQLLRDEPTRGLALQLANDPRFPISQAQTLQQQITKVKMAAEQRYLSEARLKAQFADGMELLEKAKLLLPFPNNECQRLQTMLAELKEQALTANRLPLLHPRRWLARYKVIPSLLRQLPEVVFEPMRLRELVDNGDVAAWAEEMRRWDTVFEHRRYEQLLNEELSALSYPVLPRGELLSSDWQTVDEWLRRLQDALWAIAQVTALVQGKGWEHPLPPFRCLKTALKGYDADGIVRASNECDKWAERLPPFAKAMELATTTLKDSEAVLKWLRQQVDEHGGVPDGFAERISKAINAYRLRKIVEDDQRQLRETTDKLAKHFTERPKRLRQLAKELLTTRILLRLLKAYSSYRHDLVTFRRLMRRTGKRVESFERLKEKINFDAVLAVFPCWVMTLDDVARVFPLRAGLFDVVIVDEASQSFPPSALPLLYRAKKAAIVGDSRQLPSDEVLFFNRAVNEELKRRFGIDALHPIAFDVAESSLLDLADNFCKRSLFLSEHFRSLPEIIRFSNERFYSGRLRIMTGLKALQPPPEGALPDGAFEVILVTTRNLDIDRQLPHGLKKVEVDDPVEETDKVNAAEAKALVEDLFRRLFNHQYDGLSFGVLSLFREQADYIARLIYNDPRYPMVRARKSPEPLIVSTVDGFQGDERDVIFYSFRFAPNSLPQEIYSIQMGERGEKRMNVTFTRPRKKAICYISRFPSRFPPGLVRDFLLYALNPATDRPDGKPFDSPFEQEVYEAIRQLGLEVIPQYPACGYRIDLIVRDPKTGKCIAVECDGERYHYDETGQLKADDLYRQEVLERAGWTVVRIPSRKWWLSREACLQQVLKALQG